MMTGALINPFANVVRSSAPPQLFSPPRLDRQAVDRLMCLPFEVTRMALVATA